MTFNFDSLELILEAVRDRYKHYPNQFLTEEDIRSFTIAEMLKEKEFSKIQQTRDGSWSIALHSEIRWYGVDRNLRYRSDIVLIDPTDLNTKDGELQLPSKGYGYNNFWAVVEIKLRRINGCSNVQFLKLIQAEIEKAIRIRDEAKRFNTHKAKYYLLFFDKKFDLSGQITDLIGEKREGIFIKYTH